MWKVMGRKGDRREKEIKGRDESENWGKKKKRGKREIL